MVSCPTPSYRLIPGHEVVGRIAACGANTSRFMVGDRVGIPWLGRTCGVCAYCTAGKENLCDSPQFTGYTRDGGYSELTTADERFCVPIPEFYSDEEAAPLLCAGLIGFRSLMKTGDARRIGIYGFGAAAHLVTQVAVYQRVRFMLLRERAIVKGRNLRHLSALSGLEVPKNCPR